MVRELPPTYQAIQERHPGVFESHERMSDACLTAGPLDRKTALLIRIGIAAAAKKRTPLATHIRSALEAGVSKEEIEHAILLTASTEGFSTMVQAYREFLAIQKT